MYPETDDFSITMAIKRHPEMNYHLKGSTARAALRLFDAGRFGVHQSVLPRDCLARLEQAGIRFICYSAPRRGTDNGECWTRLADNIDYTIAEINGKAVQ